MTILIQNRQRHRSLDKPLIEATARKILSLLGQSQAELSLMFIGDKKMKQLNYQYRGIDRSTDVLSFEAGIPVKGDQPLLLGDVVINVQKAEAQAIEYGRDFYDELWRLLVHGILHLMGYDHETSTRDAKLMEKKEREILNALKKVDR